MHRGHTYTQTHLRLQQTLYLWLQQESQMQQNFCILLSGISLIGWLQLVGSSKLHVSFAEHRLFCRSLLRKRPIILRSLLIVATPYLSPVSLTQASVLLGHTGIRSRVRTTAVLLPHTTATHYSHALLQHTAATHYNALLQHTTATSGTSRGSCHT